MNNPQIAIIFVTCKNLQKFVIKRCYIFRTHPNISVAFALISGCHFMKIFLHFSLENPHLEGVFPFIAIYLTNIIATNFDFQ